MFSKIFSFLFMLVLFFSSVFGFALPGYESKALFNDPDFSDGFYVLSLQKNGNDAVKKGEFTYDGAEDPPSWLIAQWNSGKCLWDNKAYSDEFTVTDGSSKWVRYNPQENSISLRLNANDVYKGEPAGENNWPHLLIEQSPINDYNALPENEKAFYNLNKNRIILDLKIRMTDFKDTTNPEGINAVQYLAYFYLKDTDGDNFIWFGVNLFDNRELPETYWAKDTVGGNMIYCVGAKDTYKNKNTSLLRDGKPVVSEEWISVKTDLTPYLEDCINRANEDNIFGEEVSLSDFYIGGTNIGFEIHGNYDCTVEIKDYNLTSYIRS